MFEKLFGRMSPQEENIMEKKLHKIIKAAKDAQKDDVEITIKADGRTEVFTAPAAIIFMGGITETKDGHFGGDVKTAVTGLPMSIASILMRGDELLNNVQDQLKGDLAQRLVELASTKNTNSVVKRKSNKK